MRSCKHYTVRLMLYRDNELDDREKREVEAHLKSCDACRAVFNRENRFLKDVKRARPLYQTSLKLRTRIVSIVEEVCGLLDADRLEPRRRGALSLFGQSLRLNAPRAAAALAALVIGAGIWGIVKISEPQALVTFAAMAADAHQRHQRGQLPLEVKTQVSSEISNWFDNKVPFTLKLPNYQDTSGQSKRYRLEGARLVGFKGDYAAFVSYQMEEHPISLVVTSKSVAAPTGKETISSKGIEFHYDTISELKVITWSHRDLTYALVSNLEERGQQSCLVCHQGAKDRDFIESLTLLRRAEEISSSQL